MGTRSRLEQLADSAAKVFLRRIYEAGDTQLTPMVHCPRRAEAVAINDCRGCHSCLGLSIDRSDRATFLRCTWDDPTGSGDQQLQLEISPSGYESSSPPPAGGSVADIMAAPIRTVSTDDLLSSVATLFISSNISAAPVVDGEGSTVGVISKTDLVHRYYEGSQGFENLSARPQPEDAPDEFGFHTVEPDTTTAKEIMTPIVMAVPASAPIPRAAALMAYEGIHHVIAHDDHGKPAGIVSSLDIIAWLARRDGFVVPPRYKSDR